jgi:hypothetical protein
VARGFSKNPPPFRKTGSPNRKHGRSNVRLRIERQAISQPQAHARRISVIDDAKNLHEAVSSNESGKIVVMSVIVGERLSKVSLKIQLSLIKIKT